MPILRDIDLLLVALIHLLGYIDLLGLFNDNLDRRTLNVPNSSENVNQGMVQKHLILGNSG